jgi:hypothetical protein
MVVVAFFMANATPIPETTISSTLRRTKSAASSGRRSFFCSANRYSIAMFFPSVQPSCSALAGTRLRELRYRKPCFHPGSLYGLFLVAEPAPQPHSPQMRQRGRQPPAIFDFGSFDVAQYRFWISDYQQQNRELGRNAFSASQFSFFNLKSAI